MKRTRWAVTAALALTAAVGPTDFRSSVAAAQEPPAAPAPPADSESRLPKTGTPQNAEASPRGKLASVRSQPAPDAPALLGLAKGTRCQVIETLNHYCRIEMARGVDGWIDSRDVRFLMAQTTHDRAQNELRTSPDRHAPLRRNLPRGTTFQVVGVKNGYYAVLLPDGLRGWTYYTNVALRGASAAHKGNYNYLRDAPSRNSTIVKEMPEGTRFQPIEVAGEYYYIKLDDGTTGWTHKDNVLFDDTFDAPPSATPPPIPPALFPDAPSGR